MSSTDQFTPAEQALAQVWNVLSSTEFPGGQRARIGAILDVLQDCRDELEGPRVKYSRYVPDPFTGYRRLTERISGRLVLSRCTASHLALLTDDGVTHLKAKDGTDYDLERIAEVDG